MTIVIGPKDVTVEAGSTVLITCVAYSDDTPSITWVRDYDQAILDSSTSSQVTVYEQLVTEGELTFVQAILEVCSVEDGGSLISSSERFAFESCVRGYHVYKDTWVASVGKNYHANVKMATMPIRLLLSIARR